MATGTHVRRTQAPTLPWKREPSQLPAQLPSLADIENATDEFPSIFDSSVRRTVLVNGVFVVKYGIFVLENEGHALLMVEGLSDVHAPVLYAMYREGERLFIVMEYVQGQQLDQLWGDLLETQKISITSQLRGAIHSIRSLPSPGYFGGTVGGPVPHRFFFSADTNPKLTGPFTTEEDFYHALIEKSKTNWECHDRRAWVAEFFDRHFHAMFKSHGSSVYTHSDFQRKNILVQRRDRSGNDDSAEADYRVTAILDWESAGWYPKPWAYSICFTYFGWSDDWPEKLEKIFDPYVEEAAMMKLMGEDLDM